MAVSLLLLLFVAGFLSGLVNAIAGGGTFLTFGALTLAGLPPVMANATSSIVQFPGYVTSTLAYASEISRYWRQAIILALVSALGALAGAAILLTLSNPAFQSLVPWLLLAATGVFAAGPWLKPAEGSAPSANGFVPLAIQFLTAVYGGFFGAGMGIMMLAALGATIGGDYHRLNALKNLLSILIAAVAITVFVSGGLIVWTHALVMLPAVALGGYAGVHMARRLPQSILRWTVVAVGLLLAAYYFIKG